MLYCRGEPCALHTVCTQCVQIRYTTFITSKHMWLNKIIHQGGRPMTAPTVQLPAKYTTKKSHCIKIQWDRNILRYHPNWRQASALSNRHIDYISLTQKYAVLNHTELRGSAPKLHIKALHQNGFLSEMLTSRLIPSQPNIVIQL